MMFTDEEVLEDLQLSHWMRITPSQLTESNQEAKREQSHSRAHRALARGSFSVAYGKGWPKASTTTQMASKLATPAHEVEPKLEGTINH